MTNMKAPTALPIEFFQQSACELAQALLGKVIRHRLGDLWLCARIIETESYYLQEKGSHASLGFTEKRRALFMPAGTIYMYYARGHDSFNISAIGEGNAVLIKSAHIYLDEHLEEPGADQSLHKMQRLNPLPGGRLRAVDKLCSGQTLLCRSLGLKVVDWDQKNFDPERLFIEDIAYQPQRIIQARRLGIPQGRDEHLLQRYIDYDFAAFCTRNPLAKRRSHTKSPMDEYRIIQP